MKKKTESELQGLAGDFANARLIKIFTIILMLFSIVLYYNTLQNFFSLDDNFVNIKNPTQVKGLAAIPEILSTSYSSLDGNSIGYRPVTRISFALEYQFTANSEFNPQISHAINMLLYALAIFLLYSVLRRLLRKFNPWIVFFIVLIFMTHPLHTEVVASLKNRDILLNFIFSFLAIKMFVKWVDFDKVKYLVFGVLSFFLALLSKETAIAQLAVFPLVLYFFTDIKLKKLAVFSAGMILVTIIAIGIPMLFLASFERSFRMYENPIAFEDNFFKVIASGFYGLGFYLKMLVFPYPLRYYYGYNMIPVVSFTNIWAVLALLAYVGMFVYAVMNIKKKTFLSFVFLYFLINISMYANIVMPVPGVVGDRFMFFPSLAFSMLLVWLVAKLLGVNMKTPKVKPLKLYIAIFLAALLTLPYSYYVIERNTNWRTEWKLFNSDMGVLWNSAKANQMYAQEQLKLVNVNLQKKVNTYEFTLGMIKVSEKHFYRAVELVPTMKASWQGLGNIYSRIHGNQAKLRAQSYERQGDTLKAAEERDNSEKYFTMAIEYYRNALKAKPDYDEAIFNIGNTYDLQGRMDSAVFYYQKGIALQGANLNTLSKLANAQFLNGDFKDALASNKEMIKLNPASSMPYVNMGNYYMNFGDTLTAIGYYETAVKKNAQPAVARFLTNYYAKKNNIAKAEYYNQKAYESYKERGN